MEAMVAWVFLACAIFGATWTFVSFHPPRRPPILMVTGFFAAWSTTELAPLHIVWQLAAVVVFIVLGALQSWPGWVALAITLVSWAGLTASVRGALHTDAEFARALHDTLGIDPEAVARRIERGRILLPFHFKRRGVQRVRNLQYVDDGSKRHRLDVYRPAGLAVDARAPVLLQIPGGAWMISNKDQQAQPLLYHLAARGWVCVAINYRLSPKATWPAQLDDCKSALAWVRAHIAEYGGDPDAIVVTGGSAGGHLTALLGLTEPGVRAMVPFYGVYDWTGSCGPPKYRDGLRELLERYVVKEKYDDAPSVYEDASPITHVNANAPATMIVHGDLDTLAPIEVAREFAARLRAVSKQPVVFVELRGAHHAFEVFNSIRTLYSIAGVETFLEWVLSRESSASSATPTNGQSPAAAVPSDTSAPLGEVSDPTPTGHTAPAQIPPAQATPGRS
jgi:acetyl esterase/lipase